MRAVLRWSFAALLLAAALCVGDRIATFRASTPITSDAAAADSHASLERLAVDHPTTRQSPLQFVGPRTVLVAPTTTRTHAARNSSEVYRPSFRLGRTPSPSTFGAHSSQHLRAIPLLI